MVIHNSAHPESAEVADHYVSRRGIPQSNRCAIASTSIVKLTWDDYDLLVRRPVRACLDSIGRERILYIVFSHKTPFAVSVPGALSTYSTDQYVADIWDAYAIRPANPYPSQLQPYYANAQSQGESYPPFTPLAAYRAQPGAMPIYSVWRLDGANVTVAKGLVDKAIQAETTGLHGQACFDRRMGPIGTLYDIGTGGGDWDLHQAAEFARDAGFAVTEDSVLAELGTAPAALRCDGAALYSGWYAYNSYNDAFTWNTGAIGYHLDSGSAINPRSGANWAANALLRGITVTSGAVSEPYLTGMPHPDIVFRSLLQGANVGDAFLRGTQWLKWMILNIGDPLYRPFPGGRAPFDKPFDEASLVLTRASLVPSETATGVVKLAAAAPVPGTVVMLASDRPTVASVPPLVTVAAGERTATFTIMAGNVPGNTNVKITANTPSGWLSNSLMVMPLLGTVNFAPATTTGGQPLTGALYLMNVAPAGGVTVELQSSNPAIAGVPASVTIPAGQTFASIPVTTMPVAAKTTVAISAFHGGAKVSTNVVVDRPISSLTVTPVWAVVGATRTLKVNLSSPAGPGQPVTLSSSNPAVVPTPSTVPIPAGAASISIVLAAGTAVGMADLTASYGDDSRTIAVSAGPPRVSALSITTSVLGGAAGTGTVTLDGIGLSDTMVTLSSDNPAATPPKSVKVPAGSSTATFQIPTLPVREPITATITATSGVAKSDTVAINPPALSAFSVSPASSPGGVSGAGTLTLTGNAPAGGLSIAISISAPIAQAPATVIMPAGTKTVTFPFAITPVSAAITGTFSATFRGITKSDTLTVNPPALLPVALSTASVKSGATVTGTITLSAIAPAQGMVVSLASDNAAAPVPATVTVPANATSVTFAVTSSPVAVNTTVRISATLAAKQVAATLKLTP